MITQEYLKECMHYDPETGDLIWNVRPRGHFKTARAWRATNTRYAGAVAGTRWRSVGCNDSIQIRLDLKAYKAHRIVWLYNTGALPKDQIDHIDGNPLNNRMSNLRDVTNQENQRNAKRNRDNTTGVTGVHVEHGRYRARITVDAKFHTLGVFDTIDEAAAARKAAEIRYGFHPNHGRAPT